MAPSKYVIILSGGSGFLGTAIRSKLSTLDNVSVLIPSRSSHTPLYANEEFISCSITDPADVDSLISHAAKLGTLTHLINSAGAFDMGDAHVETPEHLHALFDANLFGPWTLARASAQEMIRTSTHGTITTVASMAAVHVTPHQASYQIAKTAVLRLSQLLAEELAPHGIRANAVLPGYIVADEDSQSQDKSRQTNWVRVSDVARMVVWCMSDDSRPLTGGALPLNHIPQS